MIATFADQRVRKLRRLSDGQQIGPIIAYRHFEGRPQLIGDNRTAGFGEL